MKGQIGMYVLYLPSGPLSEVMTSSYLIVNGYSEQIMRVTYIVQFYMEAIIAISYIATIYT